MLITKITLLLIATQLLSASNYRQKYKKSVLSSKDAVTYLARYGYMDKKEATNSVNIKSAKMKDIILDYQRFMGLSETGQLDNKTMTVMNEPRCGVADNIQPRRKRRAVGRTDDGLRRVRRYQLKGGVWQTRNLTWNVMQYSMTRNLRGNERLIDEIIGNAFNEWSKHTNLDFKQERGSRKPNIEIRFAVLEHSDGAPFDGPGQVLAHAFFPDSGGATHFDDHETWSVNGAEGEDLLSVAVHEFGHALGLGHSDDRDSIMYPTYAGKRFKLHSDDINGIEMLYGRRQTSAKTPVLSRNEEKHNPKVISQAPDLCRDFRLDAADCVADNECFFFRDNYVWRIDNNTGVHAGYPKLIAEVFPRLSGKLDAVFTDASVRKTFVLKGDRLWIYGQPMREPILANHSISHHIKGLGVTGIGAATRWGYDGKAYLFKNDKYWRFDGDRQQQIGRRYPKLLRDKWGKVPDNVDAAMYWPRTGQTYFFKGRHYYRYDDSRNSVSEESPPFPREASKFWLKCQSSTGSVDPHTRGRASLRAKTNKKNKINA